MALRVPFGVERPSAAPRLQLPRHSHWPLNLPATQVNHTLFHRRVLGTILLNQVALLSEALLLVLEASITL